MEIHYVDGVCGSFKTTNALRFAVHAAQNLNQLILFVQPTTKLIAQSIQNIRGISDKVCIKRYDSVSCPGSVIPDLLGFLKTWRADLDGGCVVFITHKCLWDMPFFPNRSNWNLIIDEIPDVDFEYHLNLPDSSDFAITAALTGTECGINTMLRLKPRAEAMGQVRRWARNPDGDDLVRVVQPLFAELTNQHSNVYVTRASWARLGIQGHGRLDVHGWRSPSVCEGWQSVRIMGAFFEDSLLHMIWGQHGVEFRPDQQIKVETHRHDPSVGSRVSIHFFSERTWSKHLRNKISEADDPFSVIKLLVREVFGDSEFLIVANNDVPDGAFNSNFLNSIRIPAICHGLNDYRHMTNILFLSALNNSPGHFVYLDKVLGISGDRLRQARTFQVMYQSIMRTALRDAGSTEPVSVIVPDIEMANWLGDVFPGSRVISHEIESVKGVLGAPKKARGRPQQASVSSSMDRKNKSVAKAAEMLVTKKTIYYVFFVTADITFTHEANVFSGELYRTTHLNWDEVRAELVSCHQEHFPKKEDNALISGALFDPTRSPQTNKGLDNTTVVNGIWLDFDGGDLMPDEFSRIFTDVRWLMFNSFNNGKDGAVKFRVLFPTATPMTADMYHMIWDIIAERIRGFDYYVGPTQKANKNNLAGYSEARQSGLDYSKRCANSFFYMPCRAVLGKKHTFWKEHWAPVIPIMDPDRWITDFAPIANQEYAVLPAYQNPRSEGLQRLVDCLAVNDDDGNPTDRRQQALAAKAAALTKATLEWRSAPRHTGNEAFFRLAARLKAAGLTDVELQQTLYQEAAHGNSVKDRRAAIPSILKSLARYMAMKSAA